MATGEGSGPGPGDGRAYGQGLARGVARLMETMDRAALVEVTLSNGRRADVMAVDARGGVTIVEVKSSLADFLSDGKWPDYRDFCDALFFAVPADFPLERLPDDCGLILCDRWGGEVVREAPVMPLSGARRKAVLIRFGRLAASRLRRLEDPGPLGLTEDGG